MRISSWEIQPNLFGVKISFRGTNKYPAGSDTALYLPIFEVTVSNHLYGVIELHEGGVTSTGVWHIDREKGVVFTSVRG